MFSPSHRDRTASPRAARFRRSLALVPGLVLAFTVVAVPAHAAPPGPPPVGEAGRSGSAPSVTGDLPAPEHAAAHEAVDAKPKGQKVVVCKYVRKPGVAEIFSHIIVVNESALLGKGFAGTFPFAFSDAHFKSLAVRYAAKGEQAKEVSPSVCPADVPPGEEPPEEPPGEEPPGETGGVSEEQGGPGAGGGAVLPNTGAPSQLQLLALLGALCSLAGGWLVARAGRGGRVSR